MSRKAVWPCTANVTEPKSVFRGCHADLKCIYLSVLLLVWQCVIVLKQGNDTAELEHVLCKIIRILLWNELFLEWQRLYFSVMELGFNTSRNNWNHSNSLPITLEQENYFHLIYFILAACAVSTHWSLSLIHLSSREAWRLIYWEIEFQGYSNRTYFDFILYA